MKQFNDYFSLDGVAWTKDIEEYEKEEEDEGTLKKT